MQLLSSGCMDLTTIWQITITVKFFDGSFTTVGLKQIDVVEFLDTLNRKLLADLGVVRVVGEKSTFYRIRVGEVA